MKNGTARFEFFLLQLQDLLTRSAKQKNPALWLYQNNVRTPLFMLEGLAKLYSGIHNKKKFTKLKEHFKLLEDILGAIDYYDSFAAAFAKNKKIPAAIVNYLQAQTREKIQSMNELLVENNWLGTDANRIKKIQKKLNEADWLKEEAEVKAINEFYGEAIYEIVEFTAKTKFHFDNVEADVHELRRKLRWLSIYPQAFRGCIQLSKAKTTSKYLTKYITKEITSSPFNKMPDSGNCTHFLLMEQNHFYALSWMIAELGKLKDDGLATIAVKEALLQTSTVSEAAAYKKACQFTGNTQNHLQQLLDNAEKICKTFFTENILEHLVIGVAAAK
jgi:regulator of replication initiation timing